MSERVLATHDFWLSGSGFPVQSLMDELAENPELWIHDRDFRMVEKGGFKSPHRDSNDMWIRFNNYDNAQNPDFTDEHVSQWYPEALKLPSVFKAAAEVMGHVRGEQLGGIYLIKLPPGKWIHPHSDYSWHSVYYNKFVLMINAKPGLVFGWDSGELVPETGELWEVENDRTHWVYNGSDEDMIIATMNIRTFNRGYNEAVKCL
jgi:hypothetical protein